MSASEWLKQFNEIRRDFDASRRCSSSVVRVKFLDDSSVFAERMKPGPGDDFLTIDVYPPQPPNEMITAGDVLPRTPTAIMVPIHSIASVELMTEAPEEHALGFTAPSAEQGSP
jgi:hypothetical protein